MAEEAIREESTAGRGDETAQREGPAPLNEESRQQLEQLTNIQRAAVLMLLLGEQEAASIISYLDPKEVQPLGAAMVSVSPVHARHRGHDCGNMRFGEAQL